MFYLAPRNFAYLFWCCVVFVLHVFCALAFVQFGELGIDFVGLESGSPPPPPEQSSEVSLSLSASAAGGDQLSTVDNQLTYSQLQHRYISVIIIIINLTHFEFLSDMKMAL